MTMRKPKRLSREQLAPYVVEFPREYPHSSTTTETETETEVGGSLRSPRRDLVVAATEGSQPLHWPTLFGNSNPVEIEVGFGKGLFLVTTGAANPDRNYFGVEIIRKYQMYAATRVAGRALPNVKTCCDDAKRVLREFVPADSVAVVHVYFPDPWWKSRHKKRLLFTAEFAELVLRVLTPGGHLKFVTDVRDYFEMVTELLAGVPAFRPLPPPPETEPTHDMDYLTNFERKFRREGRPIHRSEYAKG